MNPPPLDENDPDSDSSLEEEAMEEAVGVDEERIDDLRESYGLSMSTTKNILKFLLKDPGFVGYLMSGDASKFADFIRQTRSRDIGGGASAAGSPMISAEGLVGSPQAEVSTSQAGTQFMQPGIQLDGGFGYEQPIDPSYRSFLNSLHSGGEAVGVGLEGIPDDQDEDDDYNYLENEDNDETWEYRADNTTRVSKNELDSLIEDTLRSEALNNYVEEMKKSSPQRKAKRRRMRRRKPDAEPEGEQPLPQLLPSPPVLAENFTKPSAVRLAGQISQFIGLLSAAYLMSLCGDPSSGADQDLTRAAEPLRGIIMDFYMRCRSAAKFVGDLGALQSPRFSILEASGLDNMFLMLQVLQQYTVPIAPDTASHLIQPALAFVPQGTVNNLDFSAILSSRRPASDKILHILSEKELELFVVGLQAYGDSGFRDVHQKIIRRVPEETLKSIYRVMKLKSAGDNPIKRYSQGLSNEFTRIEDDKMVEAIQKHGRAWKNIQFLYFPHRTPANLRHRYIKHIKSRMIGLSQSVSTAPAQSVPVLRENFSSDASVAKEDTALGDSDESDLEEEALASQVQLADVEGRSFSAAPTAMVPQPLTGDSGTVRTESSWTRDMDRALIQAAKRHGKNVYASLEGDLMFRSFSRKDLQTRLRSLTKMVIRSRDGSGGT